MIVIPTEAEVENRQVCKRQTVKIGFWNLPEIEKTLWNIIEWKNSHTTKCLNTKETIMSRKSKTENKTKIIKSELK